MRVISQRELRNQSGQVLRDAEQGQHITITRRGVPVARLVPPEDVSQDARRARRPPVFRESDLIESATTSEQILADLRAGER
jgi:prevent-host-death family protein